MTEIIIEGQCDICGTISRTEKGFFIRCKNAKCENKNNIYKFIGILDRKE